MQQWTDAKTDLTGFLNIGDIVSEDICNYFIEVLPPVTWNEKAIQMGEPAAYNNRGEALYYTLENKNGQWTYTGEKTRKEVK